MNMVSTTEHVWPRCNLHIITTYIKKEWNVIPLVIKISNNDANDLLHAFKK